MLPIFRVVSFIEGISFLLILSVTLGIIDRDFVYFLGMGHGILFALYFLLSLVTSHKQSWSTFLWLLILLASLVPFAFIAVELFLQKASAKLQEASPLKQEF